MANSKEDYHLYSHNDSRSNQVVSTMGDFVSTPNSLGAGLDIAQLLIYSDETDETNLDKLIRLYSKDEHNLAGTGRFDSLINQIRNTQPAKTPIEGPNPSINQPYLDLPLYVGTVFAIPLATIDRDVLSSVQENSQTINSTTFKSFLAKQLIDLLSSDKYKRTFIPKTKTFQGSVQEIYPYISVWVWSRSLSIANISKSGTEYEHKILNITPYITTLNTGVTANGGNFSFSLAPLTASITNKGTNDSFLSRGWEIESGTQKSSTRDNENYINSTFTHDIEEGELKRKRLYFDKVLQANDIVFIKFERLELETDRKNLDGLEYISVDDLPNQIFDMIGLIDKPQVVNNIPTADITINVTGRDLIKLLIEDGVHFYPMEFTDNSIFANETGATNTRLKRFTANGLIDNRFQHANKTIEQMFGFIINNLGSIEICPGDLFNGYANAKKDLTQPISQENQIDKRTRAFQLTSESQKTVADQSKKNGDERRRILTNIKNIASNNGTFGGDIFIFNTIKTFLEERVKNKQITVNSSNKIQSWITVENGITIQNNIPKSLDKNFVLFPGGWVTKINQNFKAASNPIFTSSIDTITSLYQRTNKELLTETTILSLQQLNRKIKIFNSLNDTINDSITYETFISDINRNSKETDSLIPILFTQADVDLLNTVYTVNVVQATNNNLHFSIINKKFTELTANEQGVFDDIYKNIIEEQNQQDQINPTESIPLAGIWQIITPLIDESVRDRRLTDVSIGNENGSLINAFRKICQDPFCEFFTDTYGDLFYFIARKKPFDKQSIVSMLDGDAVYEKQIPIDTAKTKTTTQAPNPFLGATANNTQPTLPPLQNTIIDIEEIDVIQETLDYSTEAYSWYRLQLNNLTSGSAASMSFAYLKAVYFNEFADVFGSKPLDLTTSYIPYSPVIDKNKKLPTAYFIRQGVYDLKYMIESHAYLPFTRMGTIIMNGDRRIKRGTFVRFKATNEIFYVDTVAHNYSINSTAIDRTTTLTVSRGMIERFIKGVEFKVGAQIAISDTNTLDGKVERTITPISSTTTTVNFSYFNICDLYIDESIFQNAESGYSAFSEGSLAKWKVNKSVFNFFLKKLQFAKNDKEIFDSNVNIFEK